MYMKKTQIHWLFVGMILLIACNFLFYMLGGNLEKLSTRLTYIFIHISYVQLIIVPFIVPKSKSTVLFIEQISAVAAGYFLIEFVVGSIFLTMNLDSWQFVFVVQFILAFFYGFILYVNLETTHHTAYNETQQKNAQKKLAKSKEHVLIAAKQAPDEDQELFAAVLVELETSPLVGNQSIQGLENNIYEECCGLQNLVLNAQWDEMRKKLALITQLIQLRKNCV